MKRGEVWSLSDCLDSLIAIIFYNLSPQSLILSPLLTFKYKTSNINLYHAMSLYHYHLCMHTGCLFPRITTAPCSVVYRWCQLTSTLTLRLLLELWIYPLKTQSLFLLWKCVLTDTPSCKSDESDLIKDESPWEIRSHHGQTGGFAGESFTYCIYCMSDYHIVNHISTLKLQQ